ncbi:MAG: hypothetical protein A2Y25_10675 [Candidatus Melainabacteria bacterium GWF2_37_15]|nr:MAG: hypothetical protein A2Y25_10675 [Candidatus Melainabacteria bacterium GWF2_37_15]
MITQLLNTMNTILQAPHVSQIQSQPKSAVENPFASPFITVNVKKTTFGSKNQPVPGGYFAGYHNDKINIVGKKLFIAV